MGCLCVGNVDEEVCVGIFFLELFGFCFVDGDCVVMCFSDGVCNGEFEVGIVFVLLVVVVLKVFEDVFVIFFGDVGVVVFDL